LFYITDTGDRVVRRRSVVARLLASLIRISLVFVVCCIGSGPCDELITRSREDLPDLACLIVCDLETSTMGRPGNDWGCYTTILFCMTTIARDFAADKFK